MVFKQLCRVPIDMAAIQLVIKQQVIGLERARETAPGVYVKAAVLQGTPRSESVFLIQAIF